MSTFANPFIRKYNALGLFQLFAVTAFPVHLWALLMAFRDVSWVAERTRAADAVGVVAYALLFALLETAAVFILLLVLDFLLPASWKMEKRNALLGSLLLVVSLWAMLGQLYFLRGASLGGLVLAFLVGSDHPLRVILAVEVPLVIISVALPALAILRSKKFLNVVIDLFDRVMILSALYLLFDLIGIVFVIVRNL